MRYLKIKNNLVHSTAIIDWKNLIIGRNNKIGPYAVIGVSAQHPKKKDSGKIIIGNNNKINQFVSIHRPTNIRKKTYIGNNNFIMNSCTIDHDCILEDNITLSSNVILGGNIHIMTGSNIGMKVLIHQNQVIGSYSMIGMGSLITRKIKILPGFIYYGKPAKKIKYNTIGLKRNKISIKILNKEITKFNKIKK
ncbi:hypothetical protein IDH20_00885 [Pelagibacterales bacterium SAG-MED39]|nr:hypothetical protein [Pelagibacterales bacterium SAG-MED39]